MSRLAVEELITTLSQPFQVTKPLNIAGVKPYLFAASPSITSITLEIHQGATVIFSKTLTFAEIKTMGSTTLNNWHGFIPFTNESSIFLSPGDYTIVLSASGYTYSHSNFIGWIKDRVCYIGNILGTAPTNYKLNPYSYRLLEYAPREQ